MRKSYPWTSSYQIELLLFSSLLFDFYVHVIMIQNKPLNVILVGEALSIWAA